VRALLIAPEGMLGRAWKALLEERGLAHDVTGLPAFDLLDDASVAAGVRAEHDVVINCAAWTDVDGAEEHEAKATAVNGEAVGRLARRCLEVGATLVHYGTDYVFSGDAEAPYPVDAPIDPVNAYGRSKAAGERALEEVGAPYLHLRTSWLYAPWGKNFVLTMARLGQERDRLQVVNDQRGRPTSCRHLAATTLALLEKEARGTFHVTDGGECTWFDLAAHVVGRVAPGTEVAPCTSDAFPRPAKRPAYSVLDLSATEALVGPMGAWEAHVDAALEAAGLI